MVRHARHTLALLLCALFFGCSSPTTPTTIIVPPAPVVVTPEPAPPPPVTPTTPTAPAMTQGVAAQLAQQEGVALWAGAQPSGTNGHATLGNGWDVRYVSAWQDGASSVCPTLDELHVFDLLDRGFDPQAAIDWLHAHGYATDAAWYADVAVIGFPVEYIALIDGAWQMVVKVGA